MTKRLKFIFEKIPSCDTFADVGCDHGYISNAMIASGKCKKVHFSDVSKNCLEKAEILLKPFIDEGKAQGFCCSGLEKVPYSQVVLIAGMGGEEIVSILDKAPFASEILVLQPMKNSDKVREYTVKNGYKIDYDKTFSDRGKFYDLLILSRGKDCLSQDEIDFGRGNITGENKDFSNFAKQKISLYNEVLKGNLSQSEREKITDYCQRLKRYVKD